MKVISAKTMAKIESQAYKQGARPEDFMEEAGKKIARHVQSLKGPNGIHAERILLLCGKGNNGGDTFVAGRYLLNQGFHVSAILLDLPENCSPLCQQNYHRFLNAGGIVFSQYARPLTIFTLILDGLFGTGFKGRVMEPYASLIQTVNESHIPVLAIDIPSGLNGDTGEAAGPVICATQTLYLEFPKSGFFLGKGWDYVGDLQSISFGLDPLLIDKAESDFELIEEENLKLPPIKRSWHKYERGHVVGLAGSPNMPGAAMLASLAALRGGAGIVRLLHPEGMNSQLAAAPYELIRIPYKPEEIDESLLWLNKASASFIGPGLGKTKQVATMLNKIMPNLKKPCVIDADALALFSESSLAWPTHTVLTPHTGEIEHLIPSLKPFIYSMETFRKCQQYCEEKNITLICKGPITAIFHPGKSIFVNALSDPRMATAGSGDVLTGLLASLLAQGLNTHEAALLGVYLHGMAGKIAARHRNRSMIASDIIAYFGEAYSEIFDNNRLASNFT